MTYGFLFLYAFVRTISYQNWFVNVELYYQKLFTIIAYHLNAHIMLLRYVICNYIWHTGSQNYELHCIFWGRNKYRTLFSCKEHFHMYARGNMLNFFLSWSSIFAAKICFLGNHGSRTLAEIVWSCSMILFFQKNHSLDISWCIF